jgi:hypothetical protein
MRFDHGAGGVVIDATSNPLPLSVGCVLWANKVKPTKFIIIDANKMNAPMCGLAISQNGSVGFLGRPDKTKFMPTMQAKRNITKQRDQ